ncbi:uncharacterized protein N7503_011802 [Penicillium pulvis]|uniref:uncharacterized protein n=1 Tax=Penicillium pulvis TaxID=1562058 RepID=UPI002548249E|nr:uncharacterized protein N7503_011802 [Penicillium pulvis]KAJ5786590.1 hypothetical protein N7503_011802 [Penicillium pulvis]
MFPRLKDDAKYGRFAFDIYALDHWTHDSSETSQEQWDRLVWKYQELTLIERWPYQCRADCKASTRKVTRKVSDADIQRIFVDNQTMHERNMTIANTEGLQTVWLRTCYDPRFEAKYQSLFEASGANVTSYIRVLDDSTRYDFDTRDKDFWRQVLIRMPGITDFSGLTDENGDGSDLYYKSGQNDEDLIERAEELSDLALAELQMQAGIYLLDEDSIKSGVIRILWLDEHGNVAWESKFDPLTFDLEELANAISQRPISLVESTDADGFLFPLRD